MKIFYKDVDNPQELLHNNQTSMEELELPSTSLADFRAALVNSTSLLPGSARKFQDWQVGLLDRYMRQPYHFDMSVIPESGWGIFAKKPKDFSEESWRMLAQSKGIDLEISGLLD